MSLQQKMNEASVKPALKNLKTEVANELGMSNYEQTDKGNLTARQNGYVGGYMTKKLVEMAEQQLAGKQSKKSKITGKTGYEEGIQMGVFFVLSRNTCEEKNAVLF